MQCYNCYFGYNKYIIKNFSYHFEFNKIYHLKGNNGIGKTTLLRGLSKLIKPMEGQVSKTEESQIYFLPSYGLDFFDFCFVRDIVDLQQLLFNDSINDSYYFNTFISPLMDKTIAELSDGQKQLIRLMPVFFRSKKIILLDEPFNSISIKNTKMIFEALSKLENKIILFTGHIDLIEKNLVEIHLEEWC